MGGDLRHVVVEGGGRRVELPLPAAAPTGEYVPVLVRLCEPAAAAGGRPAAWVLARAGGSAIPLTASLAEAGVADGAVLRLVDAATWHAPAARDLADVVSVAVALGPRWTARATAAVLAGTGACLVVVAAWLVLGGAPWRG